MYALRDECSHEGVPLSGCDVEDGTIEQERRWSRPDLATGTLRVITTGLRRKISLKHGRRKSYLVY
jgi:nitrite reductase/ring-hydroxylating ferredoxin subunit